MQRDALGMPDLVPVVIDHPLSTLADTQITARAEQAMVQCVATWTGNGDAASPLTYSRFSSSDNESPGLI